MNKDNLKITIEFPSVGKKIETDTDTMDKVAKMLKKRRNCPHKKTVALNEEGHAGIYCVACGEKLEDGC